MPWLVRPEQRLVHFAAYARRLDVRLSVVHQQEDPVHRGAHRRRRRAGQFEALAAAPADRPRVLDSLRATGHEVVELTMEQLEDFAGNALEVQGSQSRHLVMSARGVGSLTAAQRATIERRVPLHAVDIPTIEHAGGSARCMLAGIHLPRR